MTIYRHKRRFGNEFRRQAFEKEEFEKRQKIQIARQHLGEFAAFMSSQHIPTVSIIRQDTEIVRKRWDGTNKVRSVEKFIGNGWIFIPPKSIPADAEWGMGGQGPLAVTAECPQVVVRCHPLHQSESRLVDSDVDYFDWSATPSYSELDVIPKYTQQAAAAVLRGEYERWATTPVDRYPTQKIQQLLSLELGDNL
jgi:hypothetical protein